MILPTLRANAIYRAAIHVENYAFAIMMDELTFSTIRQLYTNSTGTELHNRALPNHYYFPTKGRTTINTLVQTSAVQKSHASFYTQNYTFYPTIPHLSNYATKDNCSSSSPRRAKYPGRRRRNFENALAQRRAAPSARRTGEQKKERARARAWDSLGASAAAATFRYLSFPRGTHTPTKKTRSSRPRARERKKKERDSGRGLFRKRAPAARQPARPRSHTRTRAHTCARA